MADNYLVSNSKVIQFGKAMSKVEKDSIIKNIASMSLVDDTATKAQQKPKMVIRKSHIIRAFEDLRPSVSPSDRQRFDAMYKIPFFFLLFRTKTKIIRMLSYADFLNQRGTGASPSSGSQKVSLK